MRILNAFLILSHDPHHEKVAQFTSKPNCSWGQLMVIYDHGKCSFGFGVWYTRALSPAPACCLVTPSPPNNYLKTARLSTHLSKTAQNYTVTRPWLSSELPWTNQLTSELSSESHTVEDFARSLALTSADLHNLKLIFMGVEQGDLGILSAIGVKVRVVNNILRFKQLLYSIIFSFPRRIPSWEIWSFSLKNL